jgi:hypothetical protein
MTYNLVDLKNHQNLMILQLTVYCKNLYYPIQSHAHPDLIEKKLKRNVE